MSRLADVGFYLDGCEAAGHLVKEEKCGCEGSDAME